MHSLCERSQDLFYEFSDNETDNEEVEDERNDEENANEGLIH